MTQTFRGVVRNNVVVLPEGTYLPEGTTVEVHVPATHEEEQSRPLIPDAVKAELRARCLVVEFKDPLPTPHDDDYEPIQVAGKPLSETIIDERR